MLEYINCDLCGADDTQLLFIKNNLKIVKCKRCNLIYINPRRAKECLRERYAGDYSLGYIAKRFSKRKRAKRIIKRIMRFKRKGRFLDIGCSAGFILEEARRKGFEIYGVEISPHGLRYAREELRVNVFEGYLEEACFPDQFFDVITMYEVIEHVPSPTALLKEVRRILKPDGLLEIWTPDIGHWRAKKKGKEWSAIMEDHLYYFDKKTLKNLLEKIGFKLIKKRFNFKPGLKIYAIPK